MRDRSRKHVTLETLRLLRRMRIDFLSDINRGYEEALNYAATDRFMVQVLWWHFGAFVLLTFLNAGLKLADMYPSPLAWRVITVPEASVAVLIAAFATLVPALLVGTVANHYLWRIALTAALTVYSYLFVFISGGSIEMHFHFFIVVALLVIYADWRLGWILFVLIGLHHGILNYIEPGWVYFYGRNDFAVIAHSVPVLVAVICTTVLSEIGRTSIVSLTEAKQGLEARTRELETLHGKLRNSVANTAGELQQTGADLRAASRAIAEREREIDKLTKELERLRQRVGQQLST